MKNATPLDVKFIQSAKKRLASRKAVLHERFLKQQPIRKILSDYAQLIDTLILDIWQRTVQSTDILLIATGGYGRKELHPCSDIDLLLLASTRQGGTWEKDINRFITTLWDMGLTIGHSVRSLKENAALCKKNIVILTNTMESRFLAGDPVIFEKMRASIASDRMWTAHDYFTVKYQEQQERHAKFHDLTCNLEPHIKDAPGGLRDIHTIGWIANRCFSASAHPLEASLNNSVITRKELRTLKQARDALWKFRYALHYLAKRKEERLRFEYQIEIAKQFGYTSGTQHQRIEACMREYYRAAATIKESNRFILQLFKEMLFLDVQSPTPKKSLGQYCYTSHNTIYLNKPKANIGNPIALLEIMLAIGKSKHALELHPKTLRKFSVEMREFVTYYNDPAARQTFIEICNTPHVDRVLYTMHQIGMLEVCIPAFARVKGLMQFNLLHTYTVDEHTLLVVQKLIEFLHNSTTYSLNLHKMIRGISHRYLLILAALFHDISKGLEGDHSILGAKEVRKFAKLYQLTVEQTELLAWLIEQHLLMSITATRENLDDIETIIQFAKKVGSVERLDHLYLLTVADVCATNDSLWNSWRAALMQELYDKTAQVLCQNTLHTTEAISVYSHSNNDATYEKMATQVMPMLLDRNIELETIWHAFGAEYCTRYQPEEIVWHFQYIDQISFPKQTRILMSNEVAQGATTVFIYVEDHKYLFARIVKSLAKSGLDVVEAKVITLHNGFAADSFTVLHEGQIIKREKFKTIEKELTKNIKEIDLADISKMVPSNLHLFSLPMQITFTQQYARNYTIMHVTATNKPGLLFAIAKTLSLSDINIKDAKIASYGEKAESIFCIVDDQNQLIHDKNVLQSLENNLLAISQNIKDKTKTVWSTS